MNFTFMCINGTYIVTCLQLIKYQSDTRNAVCPKYSFVNWLKHIKLFIEEYHNSSRLEWINERMNEMWLIDIKLWLIRISIKYSRDLINSMAIRFSWLFNIFSIYFRNFYFCAFVSTPAHTKCVDWREFYLLDSTRNGKVHYIDEASSLQCNDHDSLVSKRFILQCIFVI